MGLVRRPMGNVRLDSSWRNLRERRVNFDSKDLICPGYKQITEGDKTTGNQAAKTNFETTLVEA